MTDADYISVRRLEYFRDREREYIDARISEIVAPTSKKTNVYVLSATEIPDSAEDGDYYIDLVNDVLLQLDDDQWVNVTQSEDVVYITKDTKHAYVYILSEDKFVDITGEDVDNTLYVNDIDTDLDGVTTKGAYVVIDMSRTGDIYTLVVTESYGPARQGKPNVKTIHQTLQSFRGYMTRSKTGNNSWSAWEEFQYVIELMTESDYDEICV